jgi:chaperonin GroEL
VFEGVVPGGGVALIRALQTSEGLEGDHEDQNIGIAIVFEVWKHLSDKLF